MKIRLDPNVNRLTWLALIALGLFLSACSEVPPNNPYDPQTPVAQQARSVVSGALLLPEGFTDNSLFTGVQLRLTPQSARVDSMLFSNVSAEGEFAFENVPAGAYQLGGTVVGMEPIEGAILIDRGVDLPLRPYQLVVDTPAAGSESQWIEGVIRLEGAADMGHTGILVETEGRPFQTQTTSEGLFRLEVPAGTYTLRITADGYGGQSYPDVVVAGGEVTTIDEILLPADLSGRIVGRVLVMGPLGQDADSATNVSVSIYAAGELVRSVVTNADGRFVLDGLRADLYEIVFGGGEALAEARELVEVRAGAATDLGDRIIDIRRGELTGRVHPTGGQASVITVRVTRPQGHPQADLVWATTTVDGTYRVEGLPPGPYTIFTTAPGFVNVDADFEVELAPGESRAAPDLQLAARTYGVHAPAMSREQAQIRFTRDPDMLHARFWFDGDARPDAHLDLFGPGRDLMDVILPGDGPHRVFVQLSNAAAVDQDVTNDYRAEISPTLIVDIVADNAAPQLVRTQLAGGQLVVPSHLNIPLEANCIDAQTPEGQLSLVVTETGGDVLYSGPFSPLLFLNLSPGQGQRSVSVRCEDQVSLQSAPETASVVVDQTPPTVSSVRLNEGEENEQTGSRLVSIAITAADIHSEVTALAISETDGACADQIYGYSSTGPGTFTFTPAEGQRRLYVCARDAAGNVSENAVASNMIILDTTPPAMGILRLGSDGQTNIRTVALALENPEDSGFVHLNGDLATPARHPLNNLPAQIELTDGDGPKVVTAWYEDQAGNTSTPFSATVILDTRPPNAGQVMLANDQLVVNDQVVSALITDTAPDSMAIWEVAANAPCGDRACDDASYRAFAPASNLTLSPALEQKRICWQFCDEAGNRTTPPGSRLIRLDTHIPRPVPVLTGMVPRNHLSFSQDQVQGGYLVTISGRGFANDTRARVGVFVLPCVPSTPAQDCRTDAHGGCGANGQCADTCATQCTFNLNPQIVANAGTYPVRLETPLPVEDGLGLSSEVMFLDIVAPVPTVEFISVRGVVQAIENDLPVGQQFEVQITGRNFTDNVQFRLGANFGQVIEISPNDPFRRRIARVLLSTDALMPSDLVDTEVVAVNPTPGGGVSGVLPFGLNPAISDCPSMVDEGDEGPFSDACLTNLRTTRAPLPSGRGRGQKLRFETGFTAGTTASHGDAFGLRDSAGRLTARVTSSDGPMSLPKLPGQDAAVQIEDQLGSTPVVRVGLAPRRDIGAFKQQPMESNNVTGSQDMAVGDWDRDGKQDLVIADGSRNAFVLLDATGQERAVFALNCRPTRIETSDLNGDGRLDLVITCRQGASGYTVWLGSGDFTFEEGPQFELPAGLSNIKDLVVADFNGDHLPDLAYTNGNAPYRTAIDFGLGDGTFFRFGDWIQAGQLDRLRAGDLNGDGRPDLFGVWHDRAIGQDKARALINRGDGVFQARQYNGVGPAFELPQGDSFTNTYGVDVALGDLNFDGALDALITSQKADHVVVLLGHGDGHFSLSDRHPVGSSGEPNCGHCGPRRSRIADLNGDGFLDVVVVGTSNPSGASRYYVKMATGLGDGRFSEFVRIAQPFSTAFLSLVDLNNDGLTDVLTLDGFGRLYLWRGMSSDDFGTGDCERTVVCRFTCPDEQCRASCDEQGDSEAIRLDERVFDCISDNHRQNNYCLGNQREFPEGSWGQYIVDCAQLCEAEFIACGLDSTADSGSAPTPFTGSRIVIPGQDGRGRVDNVMIAHLDQDGRLDAIIQSDDSTVTIHFGQADGTFSSPTAEAVENGGPHVLSGGQFTSVRLVDLDGDNIKDFYGILLGGAARWARGLGNGEFENFALVGSVGPVNTRENVMYFPDLNGDGVKDRLLSYQDGGFGGPNRIGHAFGVGDGTFGEMTTLDVATKHFALFDVNGDNRADIVSIGEDGVGLRVAITTPDGQLGDWQVMWNEPVVRYLPYDYNGDGLMDLWIQREGEDEVRVIRQTDEHAYVVEATHTFDGLMLGDAIGDLNGDGHLDMVDAVDDYTLQIRYGHPVTGFEAGSVEVPLPQGGVGRASLLHWALEGGVRVTDVDGDGVDDIVLSSQGDGSIHIVKPPAPSWWGQTLTDMPQASVPLQAGVTEVSVHQAGQFISKLGVRVRIEGSGLDAITVSLRAPDGRVIELDNGVNWAEESVWQAHYPTSPTTCALASLNGWQPTGQWTLLVDADPGAQAALTDYAVITHGTFTRPTTDVCTNPIPYSIGESVWGSTVGAASLHTSNCAGRARSQEAVFSFVAVQDGPVCLNTNGSTYNTAMHVREVECGNQQRQLICDDDGGIGSQSQVELNVVAGTRYFVFVDGFGTFSQGEFVLNSAPGPCANLVPVATPICPE